MIASGDFNYIQIHAFLCLERVRELIWGLDYAMEGGEKNPQNGKIAKIGIFTVFFGVFLLFCMPHSFPWHMHLQVGG